MKKDKISKYLKTDFEQAEMNRERVMKEMYQKNVTIEELIRDGKINLFSHMMGERPIWDEEMKDYLSSLAPSKSLNLDEVMEGEPDFESFTSVETRVREPIK